MMKRKSVIGFIVSLVVIFGFAGCLVYLQRREALQQAVDRLEATRNAPEPLRWDIPPAIFVDDAVYNYAYTLDEDDTYDLPFIENAEYVGDVKAKVEIGRTPTDHLVSDDVKVGAKVYKNYEMDVVYVDDDGRISRFN